MADHSIKKILPRALVFLVCIAILILIDQWTKHLAVTSLKDNRPFVIWESILELYYLENTGAAFGTLKGMRIVFLILAPLVSVILFPLAIRYWDSKRMRPLSVCFLFIIAGAVGNFIDRLRYSYVVDFIYFKLIDFPIFNVADIYVTCSCIVLILLILFKYKDEDFGKRV